MHLVERAWIDAHTEINGPTGVFQLFDLTAHAHRVQIRVQVNRLVVQTFQHGFHLPVETMSVRFDVDDDGTGLERHTPPPYEKTIGKCLRWGSNPQPKA